VRRMAKRRGLPTRRSPVSRKTRSAFCFAHRPARGPEEPDGTLCAAHRLRAPIKLRPVPAPTPWGRIRAHPGPPGERIGARSQNPQCSGIAHKTPRAIRIAPIPVGLLASHPLRPAALNPDETGSETRPGEQSRSQIKNPRPILDRGREKKNNIGIRQRDLHAQRCDPWPRD
jgi:hypothetical protein